MKPGKRTASIGVGAAVLSAILAGRSWSLSGDLVASGWVQAAGEVRIYARHEDLGKLYTGACISGVMTKGRTMPRRLNNRYVRAYGSVMDKGALDAMILRGISIGVENYCNSPKIAIISRLVESRPPP